MGELRCNRRSSVSRWLLLSPFKRVPGTRETISGKMEIQSSRQSEERDFTALSCRVASVKFHDQSFSNIRSRVALANLRFTVSSAPTFPAAPNKAPEPTPFAVTIRAEPRLAPAPVVAHL